MKDPVYKIIDLTGTSTKSIEDAVTNAIHSANQTIKHMSWFEVVETRGNIIEGKIHHWQVTIKLGFALES
jgi:flavin-binding protein dodecin